MPVHNVFDQWWDNMVHPAMVKRPEVEHEWGRQYDYVMRAWRDMNLEHLEAHIKTLKEKIATLGPPMFPDKPTYIKHITQEAEQLKGRPLRRGWVWGVPSVTITPYDFGKCMACLNGSGGFYTAFQNMPHPHCTIDSHKNMRQLHPFCLGSAATPVYNAIKFGQLAAAVHMCMRQLPIYTPSGHHFVIGQDQCPRCSQRRISWPLDHQSQWTRDATMPQTCAKCRLEGCTRCLNGTRRCEGCYPPCQFCGNQQIPNRGPICLCQDAYVEAWMEVINADSSLKKTLNAFRKLNYRYDLYYTIQAWKEYPSGQTFTTVHEEVLRRLAATVQDSNN